MAVDNTAIGSALIIPDSLLKNLGEVDKKIKDIQDTSRATANVFNNSFASMSAGLKTGILTQLQQVINQLGQVGSAAATASSATQNMGSGLGTAAQGATNLGTSVTGVVEAINRMIGQLQQTGQVGSSSLMAAKLAANKLMEAMRYDKAGGDIANLKSRIESITSALNDTEHKMSKARQDALVEQKRRLQEELKEAERTQNERAVNLQRVLDRMMRAEQSYQRQVEQTRKKTAQDYQKQNYASNTTYSGSLSFADNANTINRRTQAIKYLTEARNALSKTDTDYTNKLATLNAKIKELNAANRQAIASSQELNSSHRKLMDTAGQLQRAFALAFSVSQIRGYISAIAETRGYFELQHKSLQSILQDGTKATEIYKKVINLALDSPFRAKELITFTKQLAAYRIENDKLYDTTKRLADVSAGLGVSMDRLALAYGQVKAAAYLRGSEVRQFTEAGVNMYGELQSYFKEVKGEAYTTAQIVDMISKRKVTFEDVEQIFKRMTDQGGLFYNMQHIQVETLSGKIGKFKDAVDQMMNSIGKSNEGLYKGVLDAATYLVQNYEGIAVAVKSLVGAFIGMKGFPIIAKGVSTGWAAIRTNIVATSLSFNVASASSTKFMATLRTMGTLGVASVKALGTALWSLRGALSGIALMFAIDALMTYWQKTKELEKATADANSELAKQKAKVSDLSYEFERLGKVKATALSQRNDKEYNKSVDAMKDKLQELVDYGNKLGMNIKINVQGLKPDDLKTQFDNVKKQIDDYAQYLNTVKIRVAESDSSFFSDGITKSAENYDKAANSFIANSYKIDDAINIAKQHYGEATEKTQQYFDVLRKGRTDGESDLIYYKRMTEALKNLNDAAPLFSDWARNIGNILKDIAPLELELSVNEIAFQKELKNVLGEVEEVRKQWGNNPVKIKAAIDNMEISEEARKAAYVFVKALYGITIPVQRPKDNELVKEARDIYWVLQNYFDTHKIRLKADVSGLNPGKALQEIQGFGKSYKEWIELEKQIKKSRIDTAYTLKEIGLEGTVNGKSLGLDAKLVDANTKVSKKDLLYVINLQKKAAKAMADAWGVDPFEKENTKAAAKAQRDIMSEQIEAYKELQSQYEKYLKIYDAETAKAKALESLRYKLQNAGIYEDAAGIVPDEKTIAERIKNIASKVNDLRKRGDAYKVVADLEFQTDDEELKDKIDKVKNEIEKAFNGLTLNTKLTDLGLHSYDIDKLFPGLKKSVNDVRNTIYREFSITPEMLKLDDAQLKLKMGEELYKEYTSAINKLNQQEVEEQRRNVEQLVKDYKNQLDSQLQIDLWYAREREKIDKNISESTLRSEMYSNLEKKYKEKSDENKWKSFQNSDAYINIFGNLENASKQTLDYLYKRLEEIKSSLHNLSPEDLKEVVEAMNKINTEQVKRNPFKGLTKNIKEYIKYLKERKKLEQERNISMTKEQELASEAERQNSTVEFYEKQYELAQKLYGEKAKYNPLAQKEISYAEKILKQAREKLKVTKDAQKAQKDITKSKNDELQKGEQAGENTKNALQDIGKYASQAATGIRGIGDAFGGLSSEAEVAVDVLDNIGQAIGNFYAGNYGGMVANAAGAISGIVQLFSGDIGRREQIADLSAEISKLQNAFERLEKTMNDAWSLSSLEKYKSEAVEDLELMNKKLEQMIQLERDCKNPDEGKITEWENQRQDNIDTIKELEENFREALGGLGSESNYKSAAQEFADAWVEAFNEGSNTLDALNKQFDKLIENIIRKQIVMRVMDRYLRPIFELIDKTVSPDGETAAGVEQLKAGLAKLKLSKNEVIEEIDAYLKALTDYFGISLNADSALSALQQGIQGITEDTASALESLLNSMRFFLATQQADVAVIKDYLLSRGEVTNDSGTTSPMLTELKNQTMVLRNIHSMWERVIKPMQGGWGLRVIGIS